MRTRRGDNQLRHRDVRSRRAMSIRSKHRAMHRLIIRVPRLYQLYQQDINESNTDTSNTPALHVRSFSPDLLLSDSPIVLQTMHLIHALHLTAVEQIPSGRILHHKHRPPLIRMHTVPPHALPRHRRRHNHSNHTVPLRQSQPRHTIPRKSRRHRHRSLAHTHSAGAVMAITPSPPRPCPIPGRAPIQATCRTLVKPIQ
jgi:hypothetical protein